jgi:hypothetical protein
MSNGTDQGLTGQQLHALQQRMTAQLNGIAEGIERRKMCVELAIRATSTNTSPDEILALARGMFEFMTEPARAVTVKIDPP